MTEVVKDMSGCLESSSSIIFMLGMWKAKYTQKCASLQVSVNHCI